MKIAHIDNNNKLLGWYDDSIHTTIPIPNIEVTDEQWKIAINNGHNKVNTDGSTELFDFRTQEEIDSDNKYTQIADAKAYLASTDWYYARKIEEGTEVPTDVVAKRIELRALINTIG